MSDYGGDERVDFLATCIFFLGVVLRYLLPLII